MAKTITTNTQAAIDDHVAHGGANLEPYRDVFIGSQAIGEAMDYANLPSDVRADLWVAIAAAHAAGGVADVADPADLPDPDEFPATQGTCDFTRAEAVDAYVAKVAHAVYIDATGVFSWRLSDYSAADIELLFKGDDLFGASLGNPVGSYGFLDFGGTPAGEMRTCIDHSPSRSYAIATAALGAFSGTAYDALRILTRDVGGAMVHSGATDPTNAATMDIIDPNGGSATAGISRTGCHCAARFMAAISRVCNIPCAVWYGYFANDFHATAAWPTLGYVLSHGDNVYNAGRFAEPLQVYQSYDYWTQFITPNTPPNASNDSLSRGTHLADDIANPVWSFYSNRFKLLAQGGWAAIEAVLDPYVTVITAAAIEDFYHRLVAITGSDGFTEEYD